MKRIKWVLGAAALAMLGWVGMSTALEQLPFTLLNRLMVEYDDNYLETDNNKKASLKIIEEPEFLYDINMQQTFVGIRIRPALVWWENRPGDSTDLQAYIDLLINHNFTPRVSLTLKDTFRRAEAPEVIEGGTAVRDEKDFNYNTLNGILALGVAPKTFVDLSAGWEIMMYDEKAAADENDHHIYSGGLRARYQLVQETELSVGAGGQSTTYGKSPVDRDSQMLNIGVGAEQIFSPNLLGSLRLGYENRKSQDAFKSSENAPAGELGLTYLPTPATRISLGGSYELLETDIYPYTGQKRARGFVGLNYDITPRVMLTIAGSYGQGDYNGEDLPQNATVGDLPAKVQEQMVKQNPQLIDPKTGRIKEDTPLTKAYVDSVADSKENTGQFRVGLTYQLNRNNWLEGGWRVTNVKSDLREDFTRNWYYAGWRVSI